VSDAWSVKVLTTLPVCFSIATFIVAFAPSYGLLLVLRAISGLCAGGILPIILALVGDLYPYEKIGVPMGWIFGSVAGGIAFGSTLGAWLNPYIGWRREFMVLGVATGVFSLLVWNFRKSVLETKAAPTPLADVFHGSSRMVEPKGLLDFSQHALLRILIHPTSQIGFMGVQFFLTFRIWK
jgi:predicted MFS family arabinose efflux permease